MADAVNVPKVFFDDHEERGLPTPVVVRTYSRYYAISTADPAYGELLSDARHYADGVDACRPGLVASARATVIAMERGLKTSS